MEIVWLEPAYYNTPTNKFPILIHDRQYQEIQLTGQDVDDEIRLDFARLMLASHDTIKGINIRFGKEAKYWALVRALDICHTEGTYRYFFHQDGMRISINPPLNPALFLSDCIIRRGEKHWIKSKAQLAAERQACIHFWTRTAKDYWASEVLLAMLLGVAIIWMRVGFP